MVQGELTFSEHTWAVLQTQAELLASNAQMHKAVRSVNLGIWALNMIQSVIIKGQKYPCSKAKTQLMLETGFSWFQTTKNHVGVLW